MNTVKDYEDNITYILENWIPKDCVVRVCKGGGPEDLNQSLAASLSKMMNFYGITRSFIVRNQEAQIK
jgi:hypothetical protein